VIALPRHDPAMPTISDEAALSVVQVKEFPLWVAPVKGDLSEITPVKESLRRDLGLGLLWIVRNFEGKKNELSDDSKIAPFFLQTYFNPKSP
jgi:hypothetical protein